MDIRPVAPSEYEQLGVLTVEAFQNIDGAGELGSYADSLRDVAHRAEQAVVLVATEGPEVLGGVTYVDGPSNPYAEDLRDGDVGIRMLAVASAAQGRGVGRALTLACVDRARAEQARRVALHSTPWMVVAHGLYRSLGFVRTPARDVDVSPHLRLMAFVLDLQ